ncbi:hypothetical protein GGH91_003662, partial [Coemansia sp. RSA 2671]
MRLWGRHGNLSVALALCMLAFNSRAETVADAPLEAHIEIRSPLPLPGPENGSGTTTLDTALDTGSIGLNEDTPTTNLVAPEENAVAMERTSNFASSVEFPVTDSLVVITLPGIDSRADDMGAMLRAAVLLENAGSAFDIDAPLAINHHLLGSSLSHADGAGNALTEPAFAETAAVDKSVTLSRADLMTVDTEHVGFTTPVRAATATPLARVVGDPEICQKATLAQMAANTEDGQSDISADATFAQTSEALPSAKAAVAPETVQTDAASPPPPQFPPEQLRRDPKALKERFNYASSDCAAVVLKANREARGLTSILNSKKDMYMLNECSARSKFVIVELCDDILVDTIVMGNYEFFSSTFRDTMVYVSDRYPPKENSTWTLLGHFQAHNSRDAQVFPVIDPKIWARYLKVEFLTHYGHEFYCPLTVLKVYGATQMEQYRKEEEEDGGDFMDTATLTVDVMMGTPALDYQLRFPYHKKPPSQLRIGEAASPAKAYLRDMQGLVDGYVARDEGEPLSVPVAVPSAPAPMPKVPNLPWGQDNANESDDYEGEDGDEDEDEVEEDEDGESEYLDSQLSDATSESSASSDDGENQSIAA